MNKTKRVPKPDWLKIKLPSGSNYKSIKNRQVQQGLATVCEEANCPNMGECWNSGTATFMLMGEVCTRGCRFCSVKTAKNPPPLDLDEPQKIAGTVTDLKLNYVVLTTVDRDDLPDQGANHIRLCVEEILKANPRVIVEILIPDFRGETDLLDIVAQSGAHVLSHNVECVERLTRKVRDPRAGYQQSLNVLRYLKEKYPRIYTKSSLMLGWDETEEEVLEAMQAIRDQKAEFLTLGQYLQPNRQKLPVEQYIHPDQFKKYETIGLEMGYQYVASGPLVRSSFRAGEHYMRAMIESVQLS